MVWYNALKVIGKIIIKYIHTLERTKRKEEKGGKKSP